jgi:signal recognition particle receptor subunit beta
VAVIDVANKTLTIKLVYYGCALGGKTTNLVSLHRLTDPTGRHGLVSIATNDDRTLFFDLLPMELGSVSGLTVKVKLYTVPGQVHYELTRRQVLSGADGVMFIADSSTGAAMSNSWAIKNLRYNLKANGLDPDTTPTILQWNKRDLEDVRPVATMQAELNPRGLPSFEAVATTGAGVVDSFSALLKLVIPRTCVRTGRPAPDQRQVDATVDKALATAVALQPPLGTAPAAVASTGGARRDFDHRFDLSAYRDRQAEEGHDRRAVDQESLLSEAVNTNMQLAERLEGLHEAQGRGERRGRMMRALARLAPLLTESDGQGLPGGIMARLLEGCCRARGSFLLFAMNKEEEEMEEYEVVPAGGDVLNGIRDEALGSLALRLCRPASEPRLIEDLANELFFNDVPPAALDLCGVLAVPLSCDGTKFGALLVYARMDEPAFDETEQEFWTTAAHLVGLSLHWHSLRKKVQQAMAS